MAETFLACGRASCRRRNWTLVGPEVKELVPLRPRVAIVDAKGITGEVVGLDDPYGSLITDIQSDDFMKLGYTRTGNRGYSKGI